MKHWPRRMWHYPLHEYLSRNDTDRVLTMVHEWRRYGFNFEAFEKWADKARPDWRKHKWD